MSRAAASLARRCAAAVLSVLLHVAVLSVLIDLGFAVPRQAKLPGERVLMARLLAPETAASSQESAAQVPAGSEARQLSPPSSADHRKPAVQKAPASPAPWLPASPTPRPQAAMATETWAESAPGQSAVGAVVGQFPAAETAAVPATETRASMPAGSVSQSAPATPAEADTQAHPDYAYNPKPDYPSLARQFGLSGKVLVRVYVAMNGSPEQILIAGPSGYEILDQAALQSVKKWRFLPARRAGRAYASWVEFNVMFDLTN